MRRVVTISYTELNAGGGVPKFNRDLHSAFPERECRHYSWWDHPFHPELDAQGMLPEWYKARELNQYLMSRGLVTRDDVIVADGFWADGYESFPYAISHSHGIWSHLTAEDVAAGKQPDMPYHHAVQVAFRRRWIDSGRPLTAVSQFIANQLRLQWGWDATVINNGVDTDLYRPMEYRSIYLQHPLIIHGVNDRGNINKGWDHIELLRLRAQTDPELLGCEVLSLDEAYDRFRSFSDRHWQKHEVLTQADLVVHPSGYEGNSMFVAEAVACGVPILGYEVGAMADWDASICGLIFERSRRSPEITLAGVKYLFKHQYPNGMRALGNNAREYAEERLSLASFRQNWRQYVEGLEES